VFRSVDADAGRCVRINQRLKPNVLQLVGSFHQGGSEGQAIQLTRLLRSSDRYAVHLACLSPEGSLRTQVERMGVTNVPAFPLTSFYDHNAAKQLLRFVKLLRSRKIVVVQTHDFYTNVFGIVGAAVAGVKGRIAARRETSGVRTRAQAKAERFAYAFANAIVGNAEAVRATLISEGVDSRKIVTIHNGLDFSRIAVSPDLERAEMLSRLNLPDGYRFVTIVANLRHPVKDHGTFLRAASEVLKAVPDAAFVLAGEGELLESMQKLAGELGLISRAFFIGRCEHINELLAVSDVCVLSSIAEGFSNAILEYMGAARPVVATDVGGAREAIRDGENGFIVPPKNPEAMAERIIRLLNDSDAASAMGRAGKRIIEEKFSLAAQLRQTEELYERLLSARTRETTGAQPMRSETF
jgi:glycosyltransferase involved in cell wall biosynthesis